MESLSKEIKFKALLVVTNAFDSNKIQKRNLSSVEHHIDDSIRSYVRDSRPKLQTLLHEEIDAESLGKPHMRELPIPKNTEWNKKKGL